MKYSELSLNDKINETRNLILEFSRSVIADIDKKIKDRHSGLEYAPYYDLIAESFFSIQSFCVLINEGLISSASAIERIILEQVSISFLLSKNSDAKALFLQIKKDMVPYLVADKDKKKDEENKIRQKYNLGKVNIHNFFDYGWCTVFGHKSMNLESVCSAAGTTEVYDMTTVFLHGFAHGQKSIHQFHRRRNGVDRIFINNLHIYLFQLFFKLLETITTEFGDDVIDKENDERFKMIESLIFDIRSRLVEEQFQQSIEKGDISSFSANEMYDVFAAVSHLLNTYNDSREKYFLSQTYMRLAKIIIAISLIRSREELLVDKNEALSMTKLFEKYKPIKSYGSESVISLDKLLTIMDCINDDWSFNDDDVDYAVAYCINDLIEELLSLINK